MAVYATPELVRRAVVRDLSRTAGTAASLGDDELIGHIATAAAEVDAALAGGGYRLPLAVVPPLVAEVTAALAAWHADMAYRGGKPPEQNAPVMLREQWARKLLDGWATGRRAIPGLDDTGTRSGDVALGAPVNPYAGRLFDPVPPEPVGWRTTDPLYDPDAYRWGADRGWF